MSSQAEGSSSKRPRRDSHCLTLPDFGSNRSTWEGCSIVSVDQFGDEAVKELFKVVDEMGELVRTKGGDDRCKGKLLATVFYESSTRTACSFQAAMARLGGAIIHVNESTSSSTKGETLRDTIACLQTYCDILALRHPIEGSAMVAASVGYKPVLNAGDGVGEHPTQALLDLYTITRELSGGIQGKNVALVGDLKHGRTVHSLFKLLSRYSCRVMFVSPRSLKMPQEVIDSSMSQPAAKVSYTEHGDVSEIAGDVDVLYMTRIQKERFQSAEEYNAVQGSYIITPQVLSQCKESMILLHPLPRVGEIVEECDSDPRAKYFTQMENGMLVRMALLALLLGKA